MNQRWIVVLAMLLLAVGVGVVAFNAGVQQGVWRRGRRWRRRRGRFRGRIRTTAGIIRSGSRSSCRCSSSFSGSSSSAGYSRGGAGDGGARSGIGGCTRGWGRRRRGARWGSGCAPSCIGGDFDPRRRGRAADRRHRSHDGRLPATRRRRRAGGSVVRGRRFDFMVLDFGLPRLDGLEVARAVRRGSEPNWGAR